MGQKKIADSAGFETDALTPGVAQADFFQPPTLTFDVFLQPFDQNQCLVLHLKGVTFICLEPEVQGHGRTFKVSNLGSK